jgi:hypothetical protein
VRQCRQCLEWFSETEQYFRPRRSCRRIYLLHPCRDCEREAARQWYAEHPGERAARDRAYARRHPDRLARRTHDYRVVHLAEIKAREALYRDANRERIRERQRLQARQKRAAAASVTSAGNAASRSSWLRKR